VFYDVIFGDTVEDIARVTGAKVGDIRRWNHIAGRAKLQDGMRLQLFLPKAHHPPNVFVIEAPQLVMTVESQEFHSHFVGQTGRARIEVTCRAGETWKSLSQRYDVSLGTLERINHKSRRSKLNEGDKVIVYARQRPAVAPAGDPAATPAEIPAALDAPREDDAAAPPDAAGSSGDNAAAAAGATQK
jgi:membrane-bound lytic murein transglycosylase D